MIECKGPTNTRVYTVAVYFRGERLAKASGHSIQQAEMNAAKEALELSQGTHVYLNSLVLHVLCAPIHKNHTMKVRKGFGGKYPQILVLITVRIDQLDTLAGHS